MRYQRTVQPKPLLERELAVKFRERGAEDFYTEEYAVQEDE